MGPSSATTTPARYRRRAALHYAAMSVQHFFVVIEWDSDDDVWVTHVPALDSLSSYGDTREAALESTREAIAGYLEAADKAGIPLPRSGPEPSIIEVEVSFPRLALLAPAVSWRARMR